MVQLNKAVAANPDSTGLRLRLADALDSMGNYPPALEQLNTMIRRDSLNYGLWYRKAQLQEKAKDTGGAIRSYYYAARVYPSPDALLAMANLYAEKKDPQALALCKQVAGQKLGRIYAANCNFISGVYYARTGNRQKAFDLFNSCITNDYLYMEAYMEKGFLYYDNKQTAEAIKVFETAVAVKNTYADAYYWLAKCLEARGSKTAAIQNYRQSLALDPNIPEATAALQRLGEK
ncbi:MAG: hypothetical protein NVS3B15_15330 [Sediminibacterium sp.]